MSDFFKEFKVGLSAFSKAHQLVRKNKVFWIYLIIPILLNLFLFFVVASLGWDYANQLTDYLYQLSGFAGQDLENLNFLKSGVLFLIALLMKLLVLVIYLGMYKYIILILLSPVLALVSEKTEEILTGKTYPFVFLQFLKDVFRGILLAIRNGIIEVFLTLVLFILSFIPVVNLFTPFLLFLVASFFYGFSMIDYYIERKRLNISESTHFVRTHKGLVIANGSVFNGLMLATGLLSALPFLLAIVFKFLLMLPLFVLSIASIYSCIAATIAGSEIDKKHNPLA